MNGVLKAREPSRLFHIPNEWTAFLSRNSSLKQYFTPGNFVKTLIRLSDVSTGAFSLLKNLRNCVFGNAKFEITRE